MLPVVATRSFSSSLRRPARFLWREIKAFPGLMWCSARDATIGMYNSDNLTYASSIAYYGLMSLFPAMLLMLAFLGRVARSEDERHSILDFVLKYFPHQLDFIARQLDAFQQSSRALGIGSGLLLTWAALGFFSALTTAINYAWGVNQFSYLKNKLVSFLMMLSAGLLMFIALLLISAKGIVGASWFAQVIQNTPGLHFLTSFFTIFLVEWATVLILILVVGLLFYFVPNAKVRFKDVWPGAIFTGLLWRLALLGFSFYIRDFSRFTKIHGSISAAVVFLLWVYVSAVILLYGVEFTVAYARLRRHITDAQTPPVAPVEPTDAAEAAAGAKGETVQA
jgi:membrane protein